MLKVKGKIEMQRLSIQNVSNTGVKCILFKHDTTFWHGNSVLPITLTDTAMAQISIGA